MEIQYLRVYHEQLAAQSTPFRIFDPELPEQDRDVLMRWFRDSVVPLRLQYSFAVPTPGALACITAHCSSLVEIGAGTGYWASLLPIPVHAYDLVPSSTHYPVRSGGPESLLAHPDASLLLCWPDESDMARQCLDLYTGDIVVYIGETFGRTAHGHFGLTGDMAFHLRLAREFHPVAEVDLPHWPGCLDVLRVYKRCRTIRIDFGDEHTETLKYIPV